MKFHTLISEFRTKLANTESQATITQTDIDQFYTKLNNFSFLFFKKYRRKYIENLNRLKPDPKDKNPDLALLKTALAESEWKPTKPFSIFIYHIKYNYTLTSKPFLTYQKRQNRKKLNAPVKAVKEVTKVKSEKKPEKEWIRVPMPRHRPKP